MDQESNSLELTMELHSLSTFIGYSYRVSDVHWNDSRTDIQVRKLKPEERTQIKDRKGRRNPPPPHTPGEIQLYESS